MAAIGGDVEPRTTEHAAEIYGVSWPGISESAWRLTAAQWDAREQVQRARLHTQQFDITAVYARQQGETVRTSHTLGLQCEKVLKTDIDNCQRQAGFGRNIAALTATTKERLNDVVDETEDLINKDRAKAAKNGWSSAALKAAEQARVFVANARCMGISGEAAREAATYDVPSDALLPGIAAYGGRPGAPAVPATGGGTNGVHAAGWDHNTMPASGGGGGTTNWRDQPPTTTTDQPSTDQPSTTNPTQPLTNWRDQAPTQEGRPAPGSATPAAGQSPTPPAPPAHPPPNPASVPSISPMTPHSSAGGVGSSSGGGLGSIGGVMQPPASLPGNASTPPSMPGGPATGSVTPPPGAGAGGVGAAAGGGPGVSPAGAAGRFATGVAAGVSGPAVAAAQAVPAASAAAASVAASTAGNAANAAHAAAVAGQVASPAGSGGAMSGPAMIAHTASPAPPSPVAGPSSPVVAGGPPGPTPVAGPVSGGGHTSPSDGVSTTGGFAPGVIPLLTHGEPVPDHLSGAELIAEAAKASREVIAAMVDQARGAGYTNIHWGVTILQSPERVISAWLASNEGPGYVPWGKPCGAERIATRIPDGVSVVFGDPQFGAELTAQYGAGASPTHVLTDHARMYCAALPGSRMLAMATTVGLGQDADNVEHGVRIITIDAGGVPQRTGYVGQHRCQVRPADWQWVAGIPNDELCPAAIGLAQAAVQEAGAYGPGIDAVSSLLASGKPITDTQWRQLQKDMNDRISAYQAARDANIQSGEQQRHLYRVARGTEALWLAQYADTGKRDALADILYAAREAGLSTNQIAGETSQMR
jgi:hypothetical protein